MDEAIAVIPARYGSTRFPGKPLADRTGRPLIQHVYERAQGAERVGRVVVATDDRRIFDAVVGFGGEAVMTSGDHPNGTSRIAEAVSGLPGGGDQVVVNVQGDEPEVEPGVIDRLVSGLLAEDPSVAGAARMATLAADFTEGEDPDDPNIVKLVATVAGAGGIPGAGAGGVRRALYFSRSRIPFDRDGGGEVELLKHPGLYAYRRSFLEVYVGLAETPLERAERLEQLRALEHGYAIAVVAADVRHHGIDTPEQYEAFVRRYRAGEG